MRNALFLRLDRSRAIYVPETLPLTASAYTFFAAMPIRICPFEKFSEAKIHILFTALPMRERAPSKQPKKPFFRSTFVRHRFCQLAA